MKFLDSKYATNLRIYEPDSTALPKGLLLKGDRAPSHINHTPDYWVAVWEVSSRFVLLRGDSRLAGNFSADYPTLN